MVTSKYRSTWVLIAIIAVSFLVKNPFLTQPFTAHFGSYQAIQAMVASEYAKQNFANFFYPNSFTLTGGLPSLEIIYHPFAAFITACLWKIFGGDLDYWGRLQAMLFSALAILLIYGVFGRLRSKSFGLAAAFLFAFSPMTLIYGRMLMNESLALAALAFTLWLFSKWQEKRSAGLLVLSAASYSLLLIFRLHYIALFPALLFWVWQAGERRPFRFLVFGFFSVFAVFAWFLHTYWITVHFPNVHTSLFAQVEARGFPDPLLTDPAFYKIFFKEVVLRLWGPFIFILMLAGLGKIDRKKEGWVWISFAGAAAFVLLTPQKFMDHPFYQLVFLVPGLFPASLGLMALWDASHPAVRTAARFLLIPLVLIPNLVLYWKPAFAVSGDEAVLREAAQYVREHTSEGDRILAEHRGSADLLYYTGRYGHNFKITADRSSLPIYFRSQKYSHLSDEEFEIRNEAYQDPIAWLEYLRSGGRVKYLVVVPRSELDKDGKLKVYLADTYTLVSPPEKEYAVYDLSI